MAAGDFNVGSVVGYLRLDKSDWSAEIKAAQGQARDLAKTNPNIKIGTNAPSAIAQLEAVASAAKKLQDAQAKVATAQLKLNALQASANGVPTENAAKRITTAENTLTKAMRDQELASIRVAAAYETVDAGQQKVTKSAKSMGDSFHPVLAAALALGPALVPLGAVAVSSLGAAALGAGALALAVKGAAVEMKDGTAVGVQYTTGIKTLQSYLADLERTAATNSLPAFNQGVSEAGDLLPSVNKQIGLFAQIAGTDAVEAIKGVAAGFVTLSPLFDQLGLQSEQLLADFDKYATGGGLQKFEAWVQANLPAVEGDITDVAQAIAKITAAAGPMGVTGLNAFGLVARAINALPIGALQVLLPLITDAYVAFQAYKGLSSVGATLDKVASQVLAFGNNAVTASAGADALALSESELAVAGAGVDLSMSAVLGPIGAVAAGVGLLAATFLGSSTAVQKNKAEIDALTTAIEQDNDAIGDNTKAALANQLLQSGAVVSANKLGISTDTFTQAILGNKTAIASVTDTLQANIDAGNNYNKTASTSTGESTAQAKAIQKLAIDSQTLLGVLNDQSDDLNTAAGKAKLYTAIMAGLGDTTEGAAVQTSALTGAINAQSLLAANSGQASIQSLTAAMNTFAQSQDTVADKSQLLGAVLVASQGDALGYANAVSAGYAADQALITAFQTQASQLAQQNTQTASSTTAKEKLTAANDKLTASQAKLAQVQGNPTSTAAQVTAAEAAVSSATASASAATDALNKAGAAATATGLAFSDTELGAIDLSTGLIKVTAAGAVPLIQQLQAMQTAAAGAAEATYQYDLKTKSQSQSLQDAQDIFESMTGGTLVANAKQLGLTAAQAQLLANQYFSMPASVTTQVQAIGLDNINDTLYAMLTTLEQISNPKWGIDITSVGAAVHAAVNDIPGAPNQPSAYQHAMGGSLNEGWNTAGENGIEALYKSGSRVQVYTNAKTMSMLQGAPSPRGASSTGGSFAAGYTTPPNKTNIVNMTVNNPVPETVAVSTPAAMRRASYALGSF